MSFITSITNLNYDSGTFPVYSTSGDTSAIEAELLLKVNRSGDTMTGPLIQNADPAVALGTATKQYVDSIAGTTFSDAGFYIYNDIDATKQIQLSASNITTGTVRTLIAPDENGTIALLTDINTQFQDDTFAIYDNTDITKSVGFQVSGLTTATQRTITIPDKDGTMAMLSDIATGLTAGANIDPTDLSSGTISVIPEFPTDTFQLADSPGDPTKRVTFDLTGITTGTVRTLIAPDQNGTIALLADINTQFQDDTFAIYDNTDITKSVGFQVSGLTTATQRTVTVPDKDGTMAMLSDIASSLTAGANIDPTDLTAGTISVIPEFPTDTFQLADSPGDPTKRVTFDLTGLTTGTTRILTTQDADGIIALTSDVNTKVSKAGDTMSGVLSMGSNKITSLATPTLDTDATTKLYVDTLVATGSRFKPSCSIINYDASGTYDNGASGVGATITQPAPSAAPVTYNGYPMNINDEALFNDAVFTTRNGAYVLTSVTFPGNVIWTRRADSDGSPLTELAQGSLFYIVNGVDGDKLYAQTSPQPTTIGTDSIEYTVISAPGVVGSDPVPIGSYSIVASSTNAVDMSAKGYLEADGAQYNIATYTDLHTATGDTFNTTGDGITTFNVPDLTYRSFTSQKYIGISAPALNTPFGIFVNSGDDAINNVGFTVSGTSAVIMPNNLRWYKVRVTIGVITNSGAPANAILEVGLYSNAVVVSGAKMESYGDGNGTYANPSSSIDVNIQAIGQTLDIRAITNIGVSFINDIDFSITALDTAAGPDEKAYIKAQSIIVSQTIITNPGLSAGTGIDATQLAGNVVALDVSHATIPILTAEGVVAANNTAISWDVLGQDTGILSSGVSFPITTTTITLPAGISYQLEGWLRTHGCNANTIIGIRYGWYTTSYVGVKGVGAVYGPAALSSIGGGSSAIYLHDGSTSQSYTLRTDIYDTGTAPGSTFTCKITMLQAIVATTTNSYEDNVFRIIDNVDASKQLAFQISPLTAATTRTITVQDADGTLAYLSDIPATVTDYPDNIFRISDNLDTTKKVAFEVSGITTATTRTITVQDADGTLAYLSDIPATVTDYPDNTFRISDNLDTTKKVAFEASGITSATTRTVTLRDTDGTMAYTTDITNDYADNVFRISDNTDATKKIAFESASISTGTVRTLTVQDANGTLAYLSDIPTLTSDYADNVFRISDNTDATKKIAFESASISTGTVRTLTVQDANGTLAYLSDIPTVTSDYADNVFRISDNTDTTKKIAFEASGITTGTVRTITTQDASGTMAYLSDITTYTAGPYIDGILFATDTLAVEPIFNALDLKVFASADPTRKFSFDPSIISPSTERIVSIPDKNGTLAMMDDIAGIVTSTDFATADFRVHDDTDATKLIALDVSALTTATTRTLSIQDADGTVALLSDIISPTSLAYIEVGCELTADGGNSVINTWTQRQLNTTYLISNTTATLVSNQIVNLEAGTYDVKCMSMFGKSGDTSIRLRNITASTTLVLGNLSTMATGSNNPNTCWLFGRFTLAATSTLEIQYWATNSPTGTADLGDFSGGSVSPALFTKMIIKEVGIGFSSIITTTAIEGGSMYGKNYTTPKNVTASISTFQLCSWSVIEGVPLDPYFTFDSVNSVIVIALGGYTYNIDWTIYVRDTSGLNQDMTGSLTKSITIDHTIRAVTLTAVTDTGAAGYICKITGSETGVALNAGDAIGVAARNNIRTVNTEFFEVYVKISRN